MFPEPICPFSCDTEEEGLGDMLLGVCVDAVAL